MKKFECLLAVCYKDLTWEYDSVKFFCDKENLDEIKKLAIDEFWYSKMNRGKQGDIEIVFVLEIN